MKKKVFMLGSKDIDTINNSDIYNTNKNLYLCKKEREKKLLQGIQSNNGLKERVGKKMVDDTVLAAVTQANTITKTFDKRFAILLDFDLDF